MQISWHGKLALKLVTPSFTAVLDPYAPSVGLPPFRSKAEVVALTNPADPSMSHIEGIQSEYILINTPGEYSIGGASLHAIPWRADDGSERSIHRWFIEDMVIVHLGALNRLMTEDELKEIEQTGVDILLVPVGGGNTLDTKQAIETVTTVEPRVVIPINYALKGLKEELSSVEQFAKEMGVDPNQREKKFIAKAGKLPQEEMHIVILTP